MAGATAPVAAAQEAGEYSCTITDSAFTDVPRTGAGGYTPDPNQYFQWIPLQGNGLYSYGGHLRGRARAACVTPWDERVKLVTMIFGPENEVFDNFNDDQWHARTCTDANAAFTANGQITIREDDGRSVRGLYGLRMDPGASPTHATGFINYGDALRASTFGQINYSFTYSGGASGDRCSGQPVTRIAITGSAQHRSTKPPPPELADELEERNDNVADDLGPEVVLPAPDDEVDALTCTSDCGSFAVTAATDPADIPEWVRELNVYDALRDAGTPMASVTFYATDAAVVNPSINAAYSDCPRRIVCLFRHAGHRGAFLTLGQVGYRYQLDDYGFENKTSSWRNRGLYHWACLYDNPSADYRKLPPRHQSPRMGRFNDKADAAEIATHTQEPGCF